MNTTEWVRVVDHPYKGIKQAQETHGHLLPTKIKVPPFTTFAVPFNWMLRESQGRIDDSLPEPLPPDEESPFNSAWVFSRKRQEALSHLFFKQLTVDQSLAFFYTKSGHPLGDAIPRLLVGVGEIEWISPIQWYESSKTNPYPLWDRLFRHSIRPDSHKGFLLPYHDYLKLTGDPNEDSRRRELLTELVISPEISQISSFSFAGELSPADVALSVLVKCLDAIRKIQEHGLVAGPWERREEWLNEQIGRVWKERGAFPGTGAALEALGMRLGTALILELNSLGKIGPLNDPWPLLDSIFRGQTEPPQKAYKADVQAVAKTWKSLSDERRALLQLLSRFSLSAVQARRWFDPTQRNKATRSKLTDSSILENPYRIVETDLGDAEDHPISLGKIDRGLLPDSTISAKHPVPEPSRVQASLDWRRVRAAMVSVLRNAAENGDALMSEVEALGQFSKLDLTHPCVVPSDWLPGNADNLAEEIQRVSALTNPETDQTTQCLQLAELHNREAKLASIFGARARKEIPPLNENWQQLLVEAIKETGGAINPKNSRHNRALTEQAEALQRITSRRLGVLVGRAGTGKTTVLGALLKSERLRNEGILFLAPTGKARVRITQKTNATAKTVAQFLHQLKRYDGLRQRPLFEGNESYRKERTVVIDESSMLTMDALLAVFFALDMAHVQRIILVGDPNQLPPIGVGRPFADLVAHLDEALVSSADIANCLGRLNEELRTTSGDPSDTLRLASWYTREPQPIDADRVLSDIETGGSFNDLEICYWNTPDELKKVMGEQLVKHLKLKDLEDIPGFNASLGLTPEGWVPFENPDVAEKFQILSPVRLHPFGVHDLNRWIQSQFRAQQLHASRQPWGLSLGDEEIVWGDKVILVRNGKRDGWDSKKRQAVEEYLANGEIGIAGLAQGKAKGKFLNIAIANRPDVRFGFSKRNFGNNNAPLELAYALTVHKAQGSEFGVVFVVLPKRSRLITRELLYTALTRSKDRLVLLIEGDNASFLYDLTRPECSETARRNTNLFNAGIRSEIDMVPYALHLVHRATSGDMVRSKSELVIANHLHSLGIKFIYERPCDGTAAPGRLRPDFSFIDAAGDVLLWEHLGMMDRDDYRKGWEWKRQWYLQNGFVEGETLFTTSEGPGLDSAKVSEIAGKIQDALG